ncbi:MAG: (2Fe-2S)-binding protein [Thermoleophilia bacterium]|nr:(2Fe-2S)-binding protein [Thermoleophilia bacterium]
MLYRVRLIVNGQQVRLEVPVETTLAELLRDHLGLLGTKIGCGKGECGACTVLLDGEAIYSCLVLSCSVDGRTVTTIEGLGGREALDPVQQSFLEAGAVQCGYCTSGMIMSAKAFLDSEPDPSVEAIRAALSGNLCRCTGYATVIEAVALAAERIRTLRSTESADG